MAYANRIRTLVLHPDPFTRAGLSATFANYSDLELVDIDTQFAALTPGQLATNAVDVVVADYAHGADLANLLSRHVGAGESCHILVVTSVDREWEIRDALARGVRGYVLFGCTLDELAAGVRAVKRGNAT